MEPLSSAAAKSWSSFTSFCSSSAASSQCDEGYAAMHKRSCTNVSSNLTQYHYEPERTIRLALVSAEAHAP